MFIYGLPPSRCDEHGCDCYCESSSKDGKCAMEVHSGYNLYVNTVAQKGKIDITITVFSLLTKILGSRFMQAVDKGAFQDQIMLIILLFH